MPDLTTNLQRDWKPEDEQIVSLHPMEWAVVMKSLSESLGCMDFDPAERQAIRILLHTIATQRGANAL